MTEWHKQAGKQEGEWQLWGLPHTLAGVSYCQGSPGDTGDTKACGWMVKSPERQASELVFCKETTEGFHQEQILIRILFQEG